MQNCMEHSHDIVEERKFIKLQIRYSIICSSEPPRSTWLFAAFFPHWFSIACLSFKITLVPSWGPTEKSSSSILCRCTRLLHKVDIVGFSLALAWSSGSLIFCLALFSLSSRSNERKSKATIISKHLFRSLFYVAAWLELLTIQKQNFAPFAGFATLRCYAKFWLCPIWGSDLPKWISLDPFGADWPVGEALLKSSDRIWYSANSFCEYQQIRSSTHTVFPPAPWSPLPETAHTVNWISIYVRWFFSYFNTC